jgi:hypothetical protein
MLTNVEPNSRVEVEWVVIHPALRSGSFERVRYAGKPLHSSKPSRELPLHLRSALYRCAWCHPWELSPEVPPENTWVSKMAKSTMRSAERAMKLSCYCTMASSTPPFGTMFGQPFANNTIRYDRRGYGRSPEATSWYTETDDLFALLRYLKAMRSSLAAPMAVNSPSSSLSNIQA